jgi:hypothetical protein
MRRVGGLVLILVAASLFALADRRGSDVGSPAALVEVPDPAGVYDPARAGEPLPEGYRPLLRRDAIHPVYEPVFVDARDIDWPDNTDVIGVAGAGQAKAYPVSHLNRREMVIDDIEGIPILVSW